MNFFNNLNFTSSNEDGLTELSVLGQTPKRILCLTGSGTRPLDMVFANASEIIALDLNHAQNALLQLKTAAIQTLDYNDYLAFIGVNSSLTRLTTYRQLRCLLNTETQSFWDQRTTQITKGLWYSGLWEKVLLFLAKLLNLAKGKAVKQLFSSNSVQEQAQIWNQHFDRGLWRFSIRLFSRRWFWTRIIGEPGGAFLPAPHLVEQRLANCFRDAASTFLFSESEFASLIFTGRNLGNASLPYHMQSQNYTTLQKNIHKIRIIQGGLHEINKLGIQDIDGFSLSDFSSYCSQETYRQCWQGILAGASNNSLFVERVFMNPLPIPFESVHQNDALSSDLTRTDKAIIYDIRAGTIGV